MPADNGQIQIKQVKKAKENGVFLGWVAIWNTVVNPDDSDNTTFLPPARKAIDNLPRKYTWTRKDGTIVANDPSFIEENDWEARRAMIQPGDTITIVFGNKKGFIKLDGPDESMKKNDVQQYALEYITEQKNITYTLED